MHVVILIELAEENLKASTGFAISMNIEHLRLTQIPESQDAVLSIIVLFPALGL